MLAEGSNALVSVTRPVSERRELLLAAYTLSGVVALAYQVLWARLLSLQFGVSIFSVAVTAAAFMLGLGLGSLAGAYWAERVRRPLVVFAVIELAIALFALVLPMVQAPLQAVTDAVAQQGSVTRWYLAQGVTTLMVLALPTTAMGFGFALVLRSAHARGLSIAAVYGGNTAGGALGALLPLVTLPLLGWVVSNVVVAAMGIVVAALFFLMGRHESDAVMDRTKGHADAQALPRHLPTPMWVGYAGIGIAALLLEVSWVRLYGMILLRTEYVVAIILTVFLIGVGLGSVLARWDAVRVRITWFPLLVPAASLTSVWVLVPISAWVQNATFLSFADAVATQGLVLLLATLPTTLLLGAWYPSLVARTGGAGHREGAWLYGVNCLGGVFGAIALPMLLPVVGTTACVVLSAALFFVGGMLLTPQRQLGLGVPVFAAVAWVLWTLPTAARIMPATLGDSSDLFVHEDALAITHVVARPNGERLLLSDLQRMDASTEPGAVAAQMNQLRLPLLLHPQAKSVLLLGLGTGISAVPTRALAGVEVTAVELAQGAIDAARDYFAPLNHDTLQNMTIVRDDARRYLQRGESHYDVIVGDLFHPDLVGRSTLLTTQQFQRVRKRLHDDGIFVQWLALNQFDVVSLETVIRSFARIFPAGSLYLDGFRLALVSRGPVNAHTILDRVDRLTPDQQSLLTGGEGGWTWLGRYWSATTVARAGPVQDEWWPQVEFALPRAKYNGDINLPAVIAWLLERRVWPEDARAAFGVGADEVQAFERAYITSELALRSWYASLTGRAGESSRLLRMAFDGNPNDRWVAYQLADQMWQSLPEAVARGISRDTALEQIVRIAPDHVPALREQWQRARDSGQTELQRQLGERIERLDPFAVRLE